MVNIFPASLLALIGAELPRNTVRTDSRLGGEMRFDADPVANATMFLTRQLEYVRSKVVDVKYAPLKTLDYLPLATDVPADVDSYVFFVYDATGQAAIINPDTKQLPRVETNAKEFGGRVVSLGDSYGWTITELRQAARLGVPLTEKKAMAARRAMNTAIDELLCFGVRLTSAQGGQQTSELGGFVNSALVSPARAPDAWLATASPIDPLKISATINAATGYVFSNTKQIWSIDTWLIPTALYTKLATTPMVLGSTALNQTVLQYILANNPWIQNAEPWWRLDGAGSGTSGGAYSGFHRNIFYKRDPEVLEAVVPIDFEQLPAQQEAMNFEVACHARCGGTKIYQPGAMFYLDVDSSTT